MTFLLRPFMQIADFVRGIFERRDLLFELSKNDFKHRYLGSYLGVLWAFIDPIFYIGILWFVFSIGLRSGEVDGVSFLVYLSTGIVPWFYFMETLGGSTRVVAQYSFLVKKVNVRLSILPIVKTVSGAAPHGVLAVMVMLIALSRGLAIDIHAVQLLYYFLGMVLLLLGLGWLTSSINVFIKDTASFVNVVIRFGFWLTPIVWNIDSMPKKLAAVLQLNPVYYIVSGYRDSIYGQTWLWERPLWIHCYFWGVTVAMLFIGSRVFSKLRPHFAEVI